MHPAILESATLFLSIAVAIYLHPSGQRTASWSIDLLRSLVPTLLCAASYYYLELQDLTAVRNLREFLPRLSQASLLSFVILTTVFLLVPNLGIVANPATSAAIVVIVFMTASVPLRALLYAAVETRVTAERVLIVGSTKLTQRLVEAIEAERHCRLNIVGVTGSDSATPATQPDDVLLCYPFVTPLPDLVRLAEDVRPDRIIVALGDSATDLPDADLLNLRGRGIVIEDGLEAYERLTGSLPLEFMALRNVIFSKDFRPSAVAVVLGRLLSVAVAACATVVLLPLFLLIAIAIKIDSPGPVFFVQERIGLYGRAFRLLKFRTMNADSGSLSEWAAENADRITRVGAWLRRYHLDETPQFLNILLGHMNLVGPRPHPVSNYRLFVESISCYAIRSVIRPGLTGWAQVQNGYANGLEEERTKMGYDLYYLKSLSFWFDLRILFDTIKAVLMGEGTGVSPRPVRAVVAGTHETVRAGT